MRLFKVPCGLQCVFALTLLGLLSGCGSDGSTASGGAGGATPQAGAGGASANGGTGPSGGAGTANGGGGTSANGGAGAGSGGEPQGTGGTGPALHTGRFSVGNSGACGLDAAGKIVCFGGFPDGPQTTGNLQISLSGENSACVLAADHSVQCWGSLKTSPTGTFNAIALAGDEGACGLTAAGTVSCWTDAGKPVATWTVPTGTFKSIAATSGFACGIAADDSVKCWGSNLPTTLLTGTFSQVYPTGSRIYGLTAMGKVACNKQVTAPPEMKKYVELAVASPAGSPAYACGIDISGSVECWDGSTGVRTTPAGTFVDLVAGVQPCGILQDGSAKCWGDGILMPPAPYRAF